MKAHTVTVEFDDEATDIETIVAALSKAGYTVPEREVLSP
jgi:copper chaperone CopZ